MVSHSRGVTDTECQTLQAVGLTVDPELRTPIDQLMPCAKHSMLPGTH